MELQHKHRPPNKLCKMAGTEWNWVREARQCFTYLPTGRWNQNVPNGRRGKQLGPRMGDLEVLRWRGGGREELGEGGRGEM